MSEKDRLNSFCEDLVQDILVGTGDSEDGGFKIDQFTRTVADYLIEAGEVEDVNICFYKSRGMQLNGYNVNQDEDGLDIFVALFNQQTPPVTVTKAQCEAAFRQAETCLRKGLTGFHSTLEESSESYDAFQRIHELRDSLASCRIFLLTDGVVNQDTFHPEEGGDISVTLHVWDAARLYRLATSGKKFEPIEIDFPEEFGENIPCLSLADPNSDYKGYLAVIPGEVLAGIYEKYGPRLLERNVRSFLQARGNVNKGIRKTILEEPHRFFAYNNGVSATADDIEFGQDGLSITKIRNLQIVNGGQTTASLYYTAKKDKADLQGIFVQAKISVIPEDQLEHIVPLISRFANSQNKVNDADFYANDPFHVEIEGLSRTVWAPAVDGSSRQSKWFYERARGQYLDAKAREGTPARKREFDATFPTRQKLTKTDLAKYENTWMQLPHIVSLGAQKNFNDFAIRLKERGRVDVDVRYFEHLIAKAIIFNKADRIVREQSFGGYKANIVTYTIAWISNRTSQRIDLDSIWKNQDISPALHDVIREVSMAVHRVIVSPPNGKNVTEWCKRKECWEKIKDSNVNIGSALGEELIGVSNKTGSSKGNQGLSAPNEHEQQLITSVTDVPADIWFQISKWSKETNNLQPWQRSLAFSIGRLVSTSGNVSIKQAKHGAVILEEVQRLGFKE
ncbi:abortive phage infection protein [Pseudomonas lundensis]|uniref:Abortive phage infection protein n=1 Tax=Pseudomonas lundensis TaxID=86185 RepID=A0ABX4GF22_9PSED|nr:AIPR family protein [Pseudomonas lundensis]NMZ56706.1 AIPR family protein [Pseudomonas lundensis]OZY25885.1 abortive phage infection protein [Pseudomonas lundensis]OZY51379.1 abortive phage infection protein [Pseudomonas lundensis]